MSFFDDDAVTAPDLAKGLLAGLVAGAAGTYLMTRAQPHLQTWAKRVTGEEAEAGGQGGHDSEQDESSTTNAARAVAEPLLQRKLTEDEKQVGSYAAHYGFGILTGGMYGAVAEAAPGVTSLLGMPAGALLFATADEGVVPATGLSRPPTEMPQSTHLYGLAAHLVYGAGTELCRKIVRALL